MKPAIRIKPTPLSPNQKIIDILQQLIEHTQLLIQGTSGKDKSTHQFRLQQFQKAIQSIQKTHEIIRSGKQAQQLEGIGKGIAQRTDEILTTGTLQELLTEIPVDREQLIVNELTSITGIGEAHARRFAQSGVSSIQDLREKALKGEIKLTHHMEVGLKYVDDFQQKIPFQEIAEIKQNMIHVIHQVFPQMIVEICGSHRRLKQLSGDIDTLLTMPNIISEQDLINDKNRFLKHTVDILKQAGIIIDDLTTQGDTKYMGVCVHPNVKIGRRIDIRFVPFDAFYPALLYFTGSVALNTYMRTVAIKLGYTLNEYGVFKQDRVISVRSEQDIFSLLGIPFLEPQFREIGNF